MKLLSGKQTDRQTKIETYRDAIAANIMLKVEVYILFIEEPCIPLCRTKVCHFSIRNY